MRADPARIPESTEPGAPLEVLVGDVVPSDEAVMRAESLVHIHGVIPSLTALDALMLQEKEHRIGTLTETEERKTMIASKLARYLSDEEVLVLRDVEPLDGPPTVLVSLRSFPSANRGFVLDHLAPLEVLGSKRDRQVALEIPVFEELGRLLRPRRFRVALRSDEFHDDSNDITVIGPAGQMFNIELRNRRSGIHDSLRRRDVDTIKRDQRRGITAIFVVPRATRRFQRSVAGLGGVVVETGVYVTATEEGRAALAGFSWMTLPVELGTRAAPRIAEQIAAVIDPDADPIISAQDHTSDPGPDTSEPMSAREIKSEVRRYLAMIGLPRRATKKGTSAERVDQAMELYRSGVPTMGEAAKQIGCHRRTLIRDFKDLEGGSPWSPGGKRDGSGRKSK